ncbi:MAG: proton-translocating NADH-quinone oxidoreductase, chain [Thermoleophilia bacterium]|nr:proton-translocating NADH-quinone oxidoreductase, chain [Thermoleophilia bacterium]
MIPKPELQWLAIGPELITAVGAMLVLLIGLGKGAKVRGTVLVLSLLTLAIALGFTIARFHVTTYGAFNGQVDSDELANVGRIIALSSALIAVVFGARGRSDDGRHGEFHALVLSAVCGMGLFVAAGSFVSLFVGLELFSIALYVLCALDAERAASLESGLKYLILGGLSSAILLYGTALVYGATGTFDIAGVAEASHRGVLVWTGAAMVLGGLAFKVSAAPMHWWTPDVYEGAGTPVTAFMSTATKSVAFLVLARVLTTSFAPESDAWVPVVAGIAVTSIVVGNVGALIQTHLKRLLGYSSIAQAGYLLVGLVGWEGSGIPALVYALIVYSAMTLGAFAYVLVLERDLGRDATLADLAGRGWIPEGRSVLVALPAFGMALCALSLAGIPPTAGFFSKFALFGAAVDHGYAWLAFVAVLGSVVSLAYYLRILVELYMHQPDEARAEAFAASLPAPSVAIDESGDPRDEVMTGEPSHPVPATPVRTPGRAPVIALVGVLLAAATLVLAFVPEPVLDLGCDAKMALLDVGSSCTDHQAAEETGGSSTDAAAASPEDVAPVE